MSGPATVPNVGRAARSVGCTTEEYLEHVRRDEKWCGGCRAWHARDAFGADSSRGDGLTTRCRVSKNGHPDHGTPTGRPRGVRRISVHPVPLRAGDRPRVPRQRS